MLPTFDNRLLRILSICALFALLIPIFLEFFVFLEAGSLIHKGDFPAFYSAAKIVSAGKISSLYDFSLQREIQNEAWPELRGSYHAFIYPPSFALFLIPLATFSATTAKLIYVLIQGAFFLTALFLARSYVPSLKKHFLESAVFSFAFLPIYTGIIAGQNTALSLCLFSAAIYFFNKPSKFSELLSGAMIGLWFFKPQYPVFFLVLFFFFRKWKLILGVIFGGALHLLLSYCLLGASFFSEWALALKTFIPLEIKANAYQMISLVGVSRALSQTFDCQLLVTFAYFFCALSFSLFFFFLRKKEFDLKIFLSFPVCILLISPHSLFYDLGLLVLAFLYFYEAEKIQDLILLLFVFFMAAIFSITRDQFIFSPFIFLIIAVFIWQLRKLEGDWKSQSFIV